MVFVLDNPTFCEFMWILQFSGFLGFLVWMQNFERPKKKRPLEGLGIYIYIILMYSVLSLMMFSVFYQV